MNEELIDFEMEQGRMDFVHALQIINEDVEETSDIKTVKSEEINFG
jgi:hypothetical protein